MYYVVLQYEYYMNVPGVYMYVHVCILIHVLHIHECMYVVCMYVLLCQLPVPVDT